MSVDELLDAIRHGLETDDGTAIQSVSRIDGEPAIGVEMSNGDLYFVTVEPV